MTHTTTPATTPDTLQKFLFDAAPVRGELVRMEATWQEVLGRHSYPAPVRRLLGEMMAAAALLSANLKFNGALVMQLHGDGPVRMLVVECLSDLSMRATAKLAEDAQIADDATLAQMVNAHGHGRFAITLDPKDKLPGQQAYQGIVPLADAHGPLASISAVLEHYMQASAQLDTRCGWRRTTTSPPACCCRSCRPTAAPRKSARPARRWPAMPARRTWIPGTVPCSWAPRSRPTNCWQRPPTPCCAACSGKTCRPPACACLSR